MVESDGQFRWWLWIDPFYGMVQPGEEHDMVWREQPTYSSTQLHGQPNELANELLSSIALTRRRSTATMKLPAYRVNGFHRIHDRNWSVRDVRMDQRKSFITWNILANFLFAGHCWDFCWRLFACWLPAIFRCTESNRERKKEQGHGMATSILQS